MTHQLEEDQDSSHVLLGWYGQEIRVPALTLRLNQADIAGVEGGRVVVSVMDNEVNSKVLDALAMVSRGRLSVSVDIHLQHEDS